MGDRCLLFLAKSITAGHTDVRTERKMKRFCTGTPAPRRRLDAVKIANTKKNISSSVYCDFDECARNENSFCSEFEPREEAQK